MDKFKLRAGVQPWHDIDEEVFAELTDSDEPYVKQGRDGKDRYYAVCPVCDNPIQIIGMFKDEEESSDKNPYGRHHDKDDMPYAVYDKDEYLACPYRRVNKKQRKLRRKPNSPKGLELYAFLRDNFDLVVDAWNRYTGIIMSRSFAEKILRSWRVNEGWRYYDSTVENLPMKLFQAEPSYTLYGRRIGKSSALYGVLDRCKKIRMEDVDDDFAIVRSADGNFLNARFFIYTHRRKLDGERLVEKFRYRVVLDDKTLFHTDVEIDQGALTMAANAADPDRENQWLDIAKRVL